MRKSTEVTTARRGKLLTSSNFSGYDACINPYVGCEFGCSYCYVRFFVKDPIKPWGDFVRLREHTDKLTAELDKGWIVSHDQELNIQDSRLVIGTMTDPYQPVERKARLTRQMLTILNEHRNRPKKVGIFTRSPIVLDDLDLIAKLPKARIHFTLTPFPPDVLRKIEPLSSRQESRWKVMRRIVDAGIRLHVNVSPVMPLISDGNVEEYCQRLAELKPAEFFVDPMQPYKESFAAFEEAMVGDGRWETIRDIMTNREEYNGWKNSYRNSWESNWSRVGQPASPDTLPIWSDHEHKVWVDMRSGEAMSKRAYGDDLKD